MSSLFFEVKEKKLTAKDTKILMSISSRCELVDWKQKQAHQHLAQILRESLDFVRVFGVSKHQVDFLTDVLTQSGNF